MPLPRSASLATQSRKLSLKLKYQRTHRTTISWLKCRPLNRSSIGTNRGICPSELLVRLHQSPILHALFNDGQSGNAGVSEQALRQNVEVAVTPSRQEHGEISVTLR